MIAQSIRPVTWPRVRDAWQQHDPPPIVSNVSLTPAAESAPWIAAWTDWLLESGKGGGGVLSPMSIRAYVQSARHFVRSGPGLALADLLQERHVTGYFAAQLSRKVPPQSFNLRLSAVRRIAAWARQLGVIADDPTRRVERQHEIQFPRRALHDDELGALEAAAGSGAQLSRQTPAWTWLGERDYLMWILFRDTGIRIDMLRRLDLDDLFLQEAPPRLRVVGKGGVHGKLLLTPELLRVLEHWLTIRGTQGTALIPDRQGRRLSTSQIRRRLQAIGRSAGVSIKPHDLRHTRALKIMEYQLRSGAAMAAAIQVTQTLMLHRSTSSTIGYLRASLDDLVLVNDRAGEPR